MTSVNSENIPSQMKDLKQWVCWKFKEGVDKEGNPKMSKVLCDVNGKNASSTNPNTWTTFDNANEAAKKYDGIGFVFTDECGIVGVDFDHIIDEAGRYHEKASEEIKLLNSYTEVSPSGTGVHVYVFGKKKGDKCKHVYPDGTAREMYGNGRFFTVTGVSIVDTPIVQESQSALDELYDKWFGKEKKEKPENGSKEEERKGSKKTPSPKMEDDEIINICTHAKNSDRFNKLFDGDISEYKNDASAADQAFCNIVTFYTQDADQVYRIIQKSKLMREKWEREDYREWTITKAIATHETFYKGKRSKLNLDSTSSKNYAYHVLANEYMENHKVKYVCGSLRAYDNGIYPASTESEIFIKKDILNLALENHDTYLSDSNVNGVIKVINMLSAVKKDECEPDANTVIVVNNGVLNLRTFELMPHDPEKVYFTKSPVDYDPNAKEPVMFKKFIETAFKGNEKQKNILQEMAGYCLCDNYKYQNIFELLGDGGNGKGTFTQLLSALLGVENTTSFSLYQLTDHRNIDYFIAGLHGKKANICGDIGSARIENTDNMKKLTSNTDTVTGRFPCEKAFEFVNHAKLIFAMNKMPAMDTFTTGEKRRISIVHFVNHIANTKDDIKDLAGKIIENGELPGILLWAIEGLKRLEAQQGFTEEKSTEEKGLEYDMVSNPVRYFVADCIEEDEGGYVPALFVYEAYNKYRKSRHMPELADVEMKNKIKYYCKDVGINTSTKRLRLGIPDSEIAKKLGKQVTCFMNIKLVSESQENEIVLEETAEDELKRQTQEMDELNLKGKCSAFLHDNPQYNAVTVTAKAAAHALITKFPNIGLMNGMDYIIETMANCKRGCRA